MKKTALIILDGWGLGDHSQSDAIYQANTPVFDALMKNYPNATLITSGEEVGLPEGQMGNSEVGHLNIGAGRIVYQELTRINKSIRERDFFENKTLLEAFNLAASENKRVHFIGLVSKGGVHSSQEHLYALCEMASSCGVKESYIHAFTDGRDCDPKSGKAFMAELEERIAGTAVHVASVVGRYYAMDRDNRWERVAKAYHLLVNGVGARFNSTSEAFENYYVAGITDEFIEPSIILDDMGMPLPRIEDGDVVICFNFRTDRPREISIALTQRDIHEHNMHKLNLHYVTMTNYDKTFEHVQVVFENDNLTNTLGEVISAKGLLQVRIAETEKYPHVTFFFSGGREKEFAKEKRILVNSPKVATYDLQPEMSALEVTDKIVEEIDTYSPDFICMNFANPDMVGHTGVYDAIIKAVETVDSCLGRVVEAALNHDYELIVIADHGNADYAINPDGSPNTAHSLNPVPVIWVNKEKKNEIHSGILADVAPTILHIMGIEQPIEMTGKSLIG
jgi:2,3-bisphosphoglycerate-independent phosphoglycerate mutase